MADCVVCLTSLEPTKRRKLYSASGTCVLTVLQEFVGRVFPGATTSVIPADHAQAFVCRPCFSQLEKILKTRQTLSQLETELETKLKCFGTRLGVQTGPSSEDHASLSSQEQRTPPRKRRLEATHEVTPPAKRTKRQPLDTPTRRVIQQTTTPQTPSVSIIVKGRKRTQVHRLTRSLKAIGRSVGRRNRAAIARQVLKDPHSRQKVLGVLGKDLQRELSSACTVSCNSGLRNTSPEKLQRFSWESLLDELQDTAPTLLHLLRSCVTVKKPPSHQRKTNRSRDTTIVGLCAAILLRHRNYQMNLVQRVISIMLYSGHASKQVYTRLQKLLLCLSHKRTIAYIDKLGSDHDAEAVQWCENIHDTVFKGTQVEETQQLEPGPGANSDVQQQGDMEAEQPGKDANDGNSNATMGEESDLSEKESSVDSPIPPEHSPLSSQISSSSSDVFGPDKTVAASHFKTFKIVGDNIDKHVKPRDMREDNQAQSLHYFHVYALRDRLDLSTLSDEQPSPDLSCIQIEAILPTAGDRIMMTEHFGMLIHRVLTKYMPFFKEFGVCFERHIHHEFYEEMSQKSEVVPLGILLKSETNYEDMVSILEHLHQYVPTQTKEEDVEVPGLHEPVKVINDQFHPIIFGGDQMTAVRARGAQRIRSNSDRAKDGLEGVVPVVEDWHAKVCILEVIWKQLYNAGSAMDGGTLYQLRNLVNRRNVVNVPKNNVAACEEFFLLVVEAHILAAAMSVFSMANLSDVPSKTFFPDGSDDLDSLQKRQLLMVAVQAITDKFVNISVPDQKKKKSKNHDNVQAYASQVLTMGLLLMEFNDAIREGDGCRILRCWRFFILIFKATKRKNYAIEAFTLLAQYQFLLSPRLAYQLKWNRTVNVHGRPGRNIPCDLHMEHLNRVCKDAISSLGANVSERGFERVGKCVGKLEKITQNFDRLHGVARQSDKHAHRSDVNDLKKMLKQLEVSKVFSTNCGRQHSHFPKFETNILNTIDMKKLKLWLNEQYQKLCTYH